MKNFLVRRIYIMKKIIMFLILTTMFLSEKITYSLIPQQINFQGVLTDNNGNVMIGEHVLTFKIYDSETSGTLLWEETQYVNISSGIFSVQLGTYTPIGFNVFDGTNRWLEITADAVTLSPRQKFLSHPYSYVAEKSYQIIGASITGANIVNGTITGDDIDPQSSITVSTLTVGTGSTVGLIKHRNYDAIRLEGTKMTFYKDITGATLNMSGNKISYIGPTGPSGYGMTLTGDGNNYMRIYVSSDSVTNSGLYIGAENGMRTGKIDLCSNSIYCYGKIYPGATGGGGWQTNNFIVADNNVSGYIKTNGAGFMAGGSDIAEFMPADEQLEPGDVVVINDNNKIVRCNKKYDTRVIGIISEKAGFLLGGSLTKSSKGNLVDGYPVALNGRVKVKVDSKYGKIKVGDLLTTSPTPGHAMKAKIDNFEKISSIIGKALEPCEKGKNKILVLIQTH